MVFEHDLIGAVLARGEFWDRHLIPLVERYADKRRVAVDVGAFIGFHSVYLGRNFATVFAFEPQRRCFEIALGNVALNRLSNVVLQNMCLYDATTTLAVAPAHQQHIDLPTAVGGEIDYDRLANAGALSFNAPHPSSTEQVQATRLDDLSVGDVAFIKVDAQGADLRVLQGARRTISASRPVIAFEYEADLSLHHDCSWQDYLDFFQEIQYELQQIASAGPNQRDYVARPLERD
jgi:FkbM family methyltransferase